MPFFLLPPWLPWLVHTDILPSLKLDKATHAQAPISDGLAVFALVVRFPNKFPKTNTTGDALIPNISNFHFFLQVVPEKLSNGELRDALAKEPANFPETDKHVNPSWSSSQAKTSMPLESALLSSLTEKLPQSTTHPFQTALSKVEKPTLFTVLEVPVKSLRAKPSLPSTSCTMSTTTMLKCVLKLTSKLFDQLYQYFVDDLNLSTVLIYCLAVSFNLNNNLVKTTGK